MANLFPETEDMVWTDVTEPGLLEQTEAVFGRSWRFDFDAGEFIMSPTRQMTVADDKEAWVIWCEKAIRTPRYRYVIYSRDYGSELEDLIGRGSRSLQESEIQRMVTETLLADARTQSVDQFAFDWKGEACRFSCRITNIHDEMETIESVVI
ncbi:DUF2634 domain-containing protein [Paenibacillus sp. HJL G12]|uniref:DUF2634 domain-containing protein n=1 Tax=Paenibacillus dendrobii TaxID=2691084 RepID=A0A7X3IJP2_9BACL|nr:DUF2634 domain-containing protein [Paenibacillus dendrobii]MWV44581.1 DUF2634 domain-containing protein [Paenibacillus dendrobii]